MQKQMWWYIMSVFCVVLGEGFKYDQANPWVASVDKKGSRSFSFYLLVKHWGWLRRGCSNVWSVVQVKTITFSWFGVFTRLGWLTRLWLSFDTKQVEASAFICGSVQSCSWFSSLKEILIAFWFSLLDVYFALHLNGIWRCVLCCKHLKSFVNHVWVRHVVCSAKVSFLFSPSIELWSVSAELALYCTHTASEFVPFVQLLTLLDIKHTHTHTKTHT